MLDVEAILRPFYERLSEDAGGIELFDAHTHIGANDPDGFRQTPAELIAALDGAGARGVVFPMHEPDGYRGPRTGAPAGSSCPRAPGSSGSTSPPSATSSRSPTSARCRSSSTPGAASPRSGRT